VQPLGGLEAVDTDTPSHEVRWTTRRGGSNDDERIFWFGLASVPLKAVQENESVHGRHLRSAERIDVTRTDEGHHDPAGRVIRLDKHRIPNADQNERIEMRVQGVLMHRVLNRWSEARQPINIGRGR